MRRASLLTLLLAALFAAAPLRAAQDRLDRGASYFLSGRLDSAIKFFSGAVKSYPDDPRAKEILGHCLIIKAKDSLREGDAGSARAALKRAGRLLPARKDMPLLSLLAELEENAPTSSVATETLDSTDEVRAVFECLFGDGPCARGGRYAVHVVRKGDTMAEIAKKYYGDITLWEKIWKANPRLTNPHRLEKGMRLQIPLDR